MGQSKVKIPPWHNIGRGSTEGKQSEYDPNQPGLQGYQEEFIETENITILLLRNNAKLYFLTISLSSFVKVWYNVITLILGQLLHVYPNG